MERSRSPEVDAYIAALPEPVGERVRAVREALHAAVPGADETIRYGMPALMLGGRYAIHFAGWKSHVGLYPVPELGGALEAEVAPYRRAKDAVALRHRDPLPGDLVVRIAARIAELHRS